MLDRAKLKSDFWPRRVWVPDENYGRHGRPIAYVSEQRRWRIGAAIISSGLIVALAVWTAHLPTTVLLLLFPIAIFAAGYVRGGRSGFYEVAEDGSLGKYLGKGTPDLYAMRGMRVP